MIPKSMARLIAKNPDKIERFDDESGTDDGYWIYLKSGWKSDQGTSMVHEWTIGELLRAFQCIEKNKKEN